MHLSNRQSVHMVDIGKCQAAGTLTHKQGFGHHWKKVHQPVTVSRGRHNVRSVTVDRELARKVQRFYWITLRLSHFACLSTYNRSELSGEWPCGQIFGANSKKIIWTSRAALAGQRWLSLTERHDRLGFYLGDDYHRTRGVGQGFEFTGNDDHLVST